MTGTVTASSEMPVPDWAVVTGASHVGDSMMVPHAAGAISMVDSQSGSTTRISNPTGELKLRTNQPRNPAVLSLESASGARPSSHPSRTSGAQADIDAAEKGAAVPMGSAGHKPPKRAVTTGSPLGSRQSTKSIVPELPAAWQAAAGIKTSNVSDTSSCCGGPVSDSGGKRRMQLCTRAWWRYIAHSVVLELKKMGDVVRAKPLILLPALAVLGIVLGLGLWALIAASNSEERFRHESATKIANDKALYIQTELDKTFVPAYVVSTIIQQDPFYYPDQPPELQEYPNKWYLINRPFDELAGDLIALTKAGSVRTVSAIPHGYIRTMYPLKGKNTTDDRNWGAIGKNWLNDSVNAAPVKTALSTHNLTIIGPYNLTQGGIGIVGMQAIFVNASQGETFDIPPARDSTEGSQAASSIPGMLNLTWQPWWQDAPMFWGLTTVLISWDALRENVTNLHDLEDQGYEYVLTRPHSNNTELAVDWSNGIDPPRPPGYNAAALGPRPLIYYDLPKLLSDPVVVHVVLPNVNWTLYVTRSGGWVPSWKAPLIAMIVVLSLVLSTLVFAVLVSRVQQRNLFREVVEAAGQLANTTRTLEEEKNRMQALLARHYDLIDLLEGGLAASVNSGAPGGGGEGDGGTRSRIDILRQKMLLSGTSARREQLGESEQVTIHELLGEGTFGKVYKGLWRGTEVAIKTIVLPANMSGKEKREKMAVMEAAISTSLAHPNIVQTYTYHIRPMRDSSAASHAPSTAAPAAATTLEPSAAAAATRGAEETLPVAASATGIGRTQALADQGAIVVGSPESSHSTLSATMQPGGTQQSDVSDAAAAAAAAVAGVGAAVPSPPGTTPAQSAACGRGVSMEQPSAGGIHSYEVQLVLEFCDRGCLRDALDAGAFFSQGGLNYPAILDTAADVAKAMLHLHLNNVLHSDLKATNVMLKSTGSESGRGVIAKVADFGLSIRLDHTATHVSHTFQGSLTHMAPEVMLQGHISKPADVYAFGITMWEIFTGGQPYKGTPGALLGHQTSKEGRRPMFPAGTPPAYRELAERCWHPDAALRPAFSEILDLLSKMRADIPGPSTPLQPFMPLHKKMAAALAAQQQQQPGLQALGFANGGGGGIYPRAAASSASGGTLGGHQFNSGVGSGLAGSAIGPLPKITGPAAIQVGSRVLSLSAAMQSVDAANGHRSSANSTANTLMALGIPGVLETIDEEGHGGHDGELVSNNTGGGGGVGVAEAEARPSAEAGGGAAQRLHSE